MYRPGDGLGSAGCDLKGDDVISRMGRPRIFARLTGSLALSAIALVGGAVICLVLREKAGEAALAPLALLAVALPIRALFARRWAIETLIGAASGFGVFVALVVLLDVVGAAAEMGPAGMAYLLPVLLFVGATLLGGALRGAYRLGRRLLQKRPSAPSART